MTTYQTYDNHTSFSRHSHRQNNSDERLHFGRDISRTSNMRSGQMQNLPRPGNLHDRPWNQSNQQAFHHLGMAHEIVSHPDPRNISQAYSAALANLHLAAQYLNSATFPLLQSGASYLVPQPSPVLLQPRGPGSFSSFPVLQCSPLANEHSSYPPHLHPSRQISHHRPVQARQSLRSYPPNIAPNSVPVIPNSSTDVFQRDGQSRTRCSPPRPPTTNSGVYRPMNAHGAPLPFNVQNPTACQRPKFRHHITGEDVTAIKIENYDPSTCSCCKGKWHGCQKCKFTQAEMAKSMQPKRASPTPNEAPDLVTVSPSSPNRSSSEASICTPTPQDSTEVAWVEDENGSLRAGEHKHASSSAVDDSVNPNLAEAPGVDLDSRDTDWLDVSYACDDQDFEGDLPQKRSRRGNEPLRKPACPPLPPSPALIAIATTRLVKLPKIPSLSQTSRNSGELAPALTKFPHTSTDLASLQEGDPIKDFEQLQSRTSESLKSKEKPAIQTGVEQAPEDEACSGAENSMCQTSKDQIQLEMGHSPVLSYSRPPCHACSQFGHYSSFCPFSGRYAETRAGMSLCWNCWASTDHNYYTCPRTRLSWLQREELRVKVGAKLSDAYRTKIGSGLSLLKAQDNVPANTPLCLQVSSQIEEKTLHNQQTIVFSKSPTTPLSRGTNAAHDHPRPLSAVTIMTLPTEILDQIFEYVAGQAFDSFLFLEDTKSKEVANGAYALSVLENCLGSVRRTCRHWRMIAQRQIYRSVYINDITSYYKFVQSILDSPELGDLVRNVKIELEQSSPSYVKWTQNGSRNSQKGPCVYRAAWRLYELLGVCTNLDSIHANFYGAIKAFDFLDDHYPKLKRLSIKDENDTGQSAKNLWRNLQRCPLLEEFTITHTKKNRQVNYSNLGISPSKQIWYLDYKYQSLKVLKLTRCPEISDAILLVLVKRMNALRRLHIDECKLLTSSGLGRALAKIPGQLHHLQYINWCDQQGMTTDIESKTPDFHLCEAIRDSCSWSIRSLKLSPYRVCSDLLQNSSWPHLQRFEIDQMAYKGCSERDTPRAFRDSTRTMAMPKLRWPFRADLGLPHVSFH